ncbi:basic salivary proline-rich protein 2-like [Tachyglossus aculeatus]|uniref:basic salivary proline-rich protein 2-like n=1 Tax=Tachyglossus aculeatus TaxID=9261 RepID=UPI0018F60EF9|nr:basic salivary proline-rich protein 2-like [Tachyglossus aculeatus]
MQTSPQGQAEESPAMANLRKSLEDLSLPASVSAGSGQPPDDPRQRIDPENSARSTDAVTSTSAACPGGLSGPRPEVNPGRRLWVDRKSGRHSGTPIASLSHQLEPRAQAEQGARLQKENRPASRGRREAAMGPRQERGKPQPGPASPGVDPRAGARRPNRLFPQRGDVPGPQPLPPGRPSFPAAGNGKSPGAGRGPGPSPGPADLGHGGPCGDPENGFLPAPRVTTSFRLAGYDWSLDSAPHDEGGRHEWLGGVPLGPAATGRAFRKPKRVAMSPDSSLGISTMSGGSPPHQPIAPPSGHPREPPSILSSGQEGRPPLPTGKSDALGFSGSVPRRRKPPRPPRLVRQDLLASREGQRCLGASGPFPCQPGRQNTAQEEAGPNPQPQPKPSLPEWQEGWVRAPPPSGSQDPTWQSNLEYLGGPVRDSVNSSFLLPFPLVSGLPQNHHSGFVMSHFPAAANWFIRCPQFPLYDLDVFCPCTFHAPCPLPKCLLGGEMSAPPRAFPMPFVKNRPPRDHRGPDCKLDAHLEACSEQQRALERERRKAEAALARTFPGKRASGSDSAPGVQLPGNPSHVDRLIADQLTERARVLSLVGEMEGLRGSPVHGNITRTLDRHLEAIRLAQARHGTEADHPAGPASHTAWAPRPGSSRSRDLRGDLTLAGAVKKLATSTRQARTALWCALQMTLAESPSDIPVNPEEMERALQGLGP